MTTIQKRRGTAAQWATANPILAAGEDGFETDTGRQKTGNGVAHWADLDYILGRASVVSEIATVTGDLGDLLTAEKDTLVDAINEAAQTGGSGDAQTIVDQTVGDLTGLSTTDKSTVVAALNEVNAKPSGGTPPPATEIVQGVAETASLAEMATGTDHSNKFATPLGVRQERAALKAELLGGAAPAWDTLQELKTLVDSAEETSTIDALTTTVGQKANSTDVYTKTEVGLFTALTTAAKNSIVAAINELKGSMANMVTSARSGGMKIIVDGVDTPTGAANELIIGNYIGSTGGSSNTLAPVGLDTAGGVIATAGPSFALARIPANGALEGSDVLPILANQRVFVRMKLYSDRIDKVRWRAAPDCVAAVTGGVALLDQDGNILKQVSSVNLSPVTVDTTIGSNHEWTLSAPVTGLVPGQDVIFVFQPTAALRWFASSGPASFINNSPLRVGTALVHCGSISSAGAFPLSGVIDLSTGFTKRSVPFVTAARTA